MDIQYFKSAWGDIKNSNGWFGKLCLLALLSFIPIFGQIVAFAYIYGWAREIAWGTHEPMPTRIFSNDDGKFWRRGWFIFVLGFVFSLIPGIVYVIGATMESAQVVMTFFGPRVTVDPFLDALGSVLRVVGFVAMVLVGIMAWVGSMRIAIYDRLSAGFQFGKIWKMMRRDSNGILRIFGMELLVSLIIGMVLSIVFIVLITIVLTAGVAGLLNSGYSLQSFQYLTQAQAAQVALQFVASAGPIGILSLLVGGFFASVATLFVELLVVRAVGYWTMQFEVPIWGGQDDPLPFELTKEPEPPANDYFTHQAGSQASASVQDASQAPGWSGSRQESGFDSAVQPAPAAQPDASTATAAPMASGEPVASVPATPVAPIPMPAVSLDSRSDAALPYDQEASAEEGSDMQDAADAMPKVTYEGPMVVGAEFVMSPEEIADMKSEIADASDAHAPHGVEDGQAGNPDIGENGEPHISQSEGGQA